MIIHNTLPLLLSCLERWKQVPNHSQFRDEYAEPMSGVADRFFDDYHSVLLGLDWEKYRCEALKLDPAKEERRVHQSLEAVEALFGFKLQGDIVIQGAFEGWDGYARFDQGSHKVYFGVDESHGQGKYLDVLIAHELTHVARESRPEVWEGLGLNPKMTNAEFVAQQPVIEHLFGEGFSCAVSELLVPGEEPWVYTYQSQESLKNIFKNTVQLDRAIQRELNRADGHYHNLYSLEPVFSHYTWAWQWVKSLRSQFEKIDARLLVTSCSMDFLEQARGFSLGQFS